MALYYKDTDGNREWFNGILIKGDMQIINPTPEMLAEEGWQLYVPPVYTPTEADTIREEIEACKAELQATDYIALKAYEGEDMTEYGDWKADRHALRVRINALEARLKELND